MICKYIYNDGVHLFEFDNESKLNDFIQSKLNYRSRLGDLVFSTKIPVQMLDSLAIYGNKGLKLMNDRKLIGERKLKAIREGKVEPYNPYLDNDVAYAAPYIGVTTAISRMRQDDGKTRLTPEFITENLIKDIYNSIKDGSYDKKYNEDDLSAILGSMTMDEFMKMPEDMAIKKINDTLVEKWKFQGDFGNAIHDVLQCYFSGITDINRETVAIKNIRNRNLKRSELIRLVRKGFDTESIKNGGNTIMNGQHIDGISEKMLSDKVIYSILEYAEKLHENINARFEDPMIISEFPVYDESEVEVYDLKTGEKKLMKMIGSIDLLVIDKNGVPHIIDYKTTTKSYQEMSRYGTVNAKVRTYTYQQGIYKRMINRNTELDTRGSLCMIAGIHLGPIKYDENEKRWRCDSVIHDASFGIPYDISDNINEESIITNINNIMPESPVSVIDTSHLHEKIEKDNSLLLPEYGYEWREMSNETAKRIFDERVVKDKATGKYKLCTDRRKKYVLVSDGNEVSASTPEEMINVIKSYYGNKPELRRLKVESVRTNMISALMNGSRDIQIFDENGKYKIKNHSLNNKLREYTDGNWRVMNNDAAKQVANYGIILVENIMNGQVDVINLTNIDLFQMHNFDEKGNNKLLTSIFGRPDIEENAKSNSDHEMLKAYEGNIEIMKTMNVLYNVKELFDNGRYIGNIRVINYENGTEIPAKNSDISYSYQRLRNLGGMDKAEGLKIADTIDLIKLRLINMQTIFDMEENNVFERFRELNKKGKFLTNTRRFYGDSGDKVSYYSLLENADNQEKIEILKSLANTLEDQYEVVKKALESKTTELISSSTSASEYQAIALYKDILDAIAELNNVHMTQQLESTKRWSQYAITDILSNGFQSTEFDNAGMMASNILNSFSRVLMNSYQITRDEMNAPISRIVAIEDRVIKMMHGSKLMHTFKSKEDLWNDFYRRDAEGNISEEMKFKYLDDKSLSPEQRDILDKLLLEINRYRYAGKNGNLPTDEEVRGHMYDDDYYNIPLLLKRTSDVNISSGDEGEKKLNRASRFINGLKDFFFGEAGEHTRDTEFESRASEIFGENDIFKKELNGEAREKYIASKGVSSFNLNAANVALNFILNNRLKKNVDNAIMIAKCSIIHLKANANTINKKDKDENTLFENDIAWLMDFIRGRIKNEDINETNFKGLVRILDSVSNLAVKATLGFSVNQMTYQSIQGLFTNASLCMRKVLGDDSFNKSDWGRAISIVYSDAVKSDSHNLLNQINILYGINDADIKKYVESANNRADLTSSAGFWRIGMKCASRPDFYNRMQIFVAQMIHDGVWDAYSLKNGMIYYDFKKDKRFSKLVDPNATKDEEYYRQLGLYKAIGRQLALEGAIIPASQSKSGKQEVFEFSEDANPIDNPLPKPYTSQQSEAYKNVGDDTYGYYSSDKKALIHLRWAGNMFMQFKTYFSGKKNQYFMTGGVRMRGTHKHAKDDEGNYLYEVMVDENGKNDTFIMSMKDGKMYLNGNEYTGNIKAKIPLFRWKGMYQEGIALTMYKLIKQGVLEDIKVGDWSFKNFKNVWNGYSQSDDESIRACFRNNLVQLLNDMIIFLLIGILAAGGVSKMAEEKSEDEDVSAIAKDASMLIAKSITSAALDFNASKSIFGVFTNWTPMSISWATNLVENTCKMATGDMTPISWGASSFTAARQFRATISDIFESDN